MFLPFFFDKIFRIWYHICKKKEVFMMNQRLLKLFVILLFCLLFVAIPISFVKADLIGDTRGDSGTAPPPPTPADSSPGTVTPPEPTFSTTHIIHNPPVIFHTSIEGNVNEEVGECSTSENTASDSGSRAIPIPYVKVQFGDNVVRTDSNGHFQIGGTPGSHDLTYTYGDISGLSDKTAIQTALKYNGHDYIVSSIKANDMVISRTSIIETIIKQSGKGCSQVFLLIDCSSSMRFNKVNIYGQQKSRIQVIVDSAKDLVDSLIDSGENIYIGIVAFSGTSYKALGLSQDKGVLKAKLQKIVDKNWYNGNTNMVAALDKAEDSFLNKGSDSNRTIILLSDGIPTSDGNTKTYSDDSDETIMAKLRTVKESTINKVKQVVNGGTKLYTLISKSDPDVNEWAAQIFQGNATRFSNVEEGAQVVNEITQEIESFILTNTDEQTYTDKIQIIKGAENATRRQEVNNYFANKKFYYGIENNNSIRTSLFQQIDNYNNIEDANKLSELTYMTIDRGSYTLDEITHELGIFTRTEEKEELNPITGEMETVTYTYIDEYREEPYNVGTVYLAQLPALSLVTKTTATGLQVVLADHQILQSQVQQPGSDIPLIQVLDDEISHGATIIVEYAITVKNQSSIQCNHLELLAHLPPNFVYRENNNLITESSTNSSQGWKLVNKEDLYSQGYITSETLEQNKGRQAIMITLDNEGQGADGFYIPSGGEYTIKVNISTVISNLNSWNGDQHLYAEILGYKDNADRRMAYPQSKTYGGSTYSSLVGVYPGNNCEQDYSGGANSTNVVYVLPPTGLFTQRNRSYLITVTICIAILGTVFVLEKKHQKNRKRKA